MEKNRPYEQIATRFEISKESARYFLNHVQKSFKTERPPHKLILDFVESQKLEDLPSPYEVATMMNENGIWDHALGSPPPVIIDDDGE